MGLFTLTVFPDGRMMLTTDDLLTPETARQIADLFDRWMQDEAHRVLVIPDTKVQHATSFEVDLTGPEAVAG